LGGKNSKLNAGLTESSISFTSIICPFSISATKASKLRYIIAVNFLITKKP